MNKNFETKKDDVVDISSFIPLKIDYFVDKYNNWDFENFICELYKYFQKETKNWKSWQEMIYLLEDFKKELLKEEKEIESMKKSIISKVRLLVESKIKKYQNIKENKIKIVRYINYLFRYFNIYKNDFLTQLDILQTFTFSPKNLERLVSNLELRIYLNEIKKSWDIQREMINKKNKKWNISKRDDNVVFVNFK